MKQPKKMEFYINDNKFSRYQAGAGRDYKVSLINHASYDVLPMIDPFTTLIGDFVSGKRRQQQDLWDARLHGEIVRYAICQGI